MEGLGLRRVRWLVPQPHRATQRPVREAVKALAACSIDVYFQAAGPSLDEAVVVEPHQWEWSMQRPALSL